MAPLSPPCRWTLRPWLSGLTLPSVVAVVVVITLLPASTEGDTRAEPRNIHTVFSTECTPYFDWQSVGLVHSHRKVGMPGRITRLMACDEAKLANHKYKDAVPTYAHPNFAGYASENGDFYPSYNKPGSVMHWLEHVDVEEEWIMFIDADMLFRKPITPKDLGVEKGLAVAGYYGYLIGVDNKELSMKFVPEEKLPMLAKVGGWTVMHREDLRRVAPLWLEYTKKVRKWGPDVWFHIGDVYVTEAHPLPWLSEMYGYVYGAALANVSHKTNNDVMLYPGYEPYKDPFILHYGLKIDLGSFSFDKHHHRSDQLACPGILFPEPSAADIPPQSTKIAKKRDDLIIECMSSLNEALSEYIDKSCKSTLSAKFEHKPKKSEAECENMNKLCENWAQKGECVANPGFMTASCPTSKCKDFYSECGEWASNGECSDNLIYMMERCTKSCGFCGDEPSSKQSRAFSTPAEKTVSTPSERPSQQKIERSQARPGSKSSNPDFIHDTQLPDVEDTSEFKLFSIDISKSTPLGAFNRSLLQGFGWSGVLVVFFSGVTLLSKALSKKHAKKLLELREAPPSATTEVASSSRSSARRRNPTK